MPLRYLKHQDGTFRPVNCTNGRPFDHFYIFGCRRPERAQTRRHTAGARRAQRGSGLRFVFGYTMGAAQAALLQWVAVLQRVIIGTQSPSQPNSGRLTTPLFGDRFHTTANDRQRRWTGLGSAGDDRHLQESR
jgi:hypothetical protein